MTGATLELRPEEEEGLRCREDMKAAERGSGNGDGASDRNSCGRGKHEVKY